MVQWRGIRGDTVFGGTRYSGGHGIRGDTVFGGTVLGFLLHIDL